jgi:D-glycerate 3-kinase
MNWQRVRPEVERFIASEGLSVDFLPLVESWYWPLAKHCADRVHETSVVGINGAQGSGKSTLAAVLDLLLAHGAGIKCAVVSIDDFYLPLAQRQQLSENTHPLLKVRGVPGTHDTDLALHTLEQLIALPPGEALAIPRFNKASDDRFPTARCNQITGPVDLVILEGWCVGASAQSAAQLAAPVNALEKEHDPDGRWRGYVNQQLSGGYQVLFSMIDCLLMLKSPSIACIEQWRWLQEEKLIQASAGRGAGLMNRQQVSEFIQYYQRLTLHCLDNMPSTAQLVYHLSADHQITHASGPLSSRLAR